MPYYYYFLYSHWQYEMAILKHFLNINLYQNILKHILFQYIHLNIFKTYLK